MKPALLIAVLGAVVISVFGVEANAANSGDSPKSYSGIIARQVTSWGIYDVKACPQGIRIHTQYGAILVAKPPDWTVYIFRNGEKRAAKNVVCNVSNKKSQGCEAFSN